MATIVHDNFRNAQLGTPNGTTTTVDFDADDIRCSLMDSTDSGVIAVTDSNFGEIDTGVEGTDYHTGSAMGSKTVGTGGGVGAFDSTVDYTFSSVPASDEMDYLVLRKYHATPANSTLIVTWDSTTTGIPVTPNGGDIIVTWNASGILRI
jgi:hypothetical protein